MDWNSDLRSAFWITAGVLVAAVVLIFGLGFCAGKAWSMDRLDVLLTNYSGETLDVGSPATIYTTGNQTWAFDVAGGNATWIAGVLQSNCTNGTTCRVALAGVAWVRLLSGCRNASGTYSPHQNCSGVNNGTAFNTTAAVGDWLLMSYADGQANATSTFSNETAYIGRAMTANNGSCGNNRVRVLLRMNYR